MSAATVCPCGHAAVYHASDRQQEAYIRATRGRLARECNGADSRLPHCHCTMSRSEVMADANGDRS